MTWWPKRQMERGSGLIEFSLLIMILMLLAIGVFDFGLVVEQRIMVSASAHAGAQFGATEGNANNTAGMQTAAVNAAAGIAGFSATAKAWCSCTAGGATVSCSSTCNTYDIPIQYVQVQTSVSAPLPLHFLGFPSTIPLAESVTLRAK